MVTTIIATIAGTVAISSGVTGLARWIFKRGHASGKHQAAIEAEQRAQADAQAQGQARIRELQAQMAQLQADLELIRAQSPRPL